LVGVQSNGMLRKSELPTIRPAFDVDGYARASDTKLVTAARSAPDPESPVPHSETRLAARPDSDAALTDEDWARTVTGNLVLTMPLDELKRLELDNRAGYLIFWMDGSIDLETLAQVSMVMREEVLAIVRRLYEAGVVDFR
jgi:hypothetical protein